ncbi:prenyltransferase/squalene oxidase repeat-containing protein [Streptomyces mobaraensis]|uniref:Terpene cyclase/mutase family protein n=1 Tax=Streptomyces mobaraensis TaxID=35621 RepID=A0A5N5W8C5_STRMB|nr:prenyltransferase/squalene oxidase repeat-containing protein [Streptomyces mobaraensis]KAB7845481.1 terpene cyclase/mutase family protein [Streptomyces mobaraensis]
MTQSVRSGRGAALPLALVGAALLSAGTAGLAFAGEAPGEGRPAATKFESPAKAAAAWAVKDLNAMLDAKDGKPKDHGLIADLVMGLASTRTAGEIAAKATDTLAAEAEQYAFAGGDKNKVNSGGVAKLALVAEIEGRNPTDFGGRNLIELLKRSQQPNGRFKGYQGDPSNQFTQSLAVLALRRAGEHKAAEDGAAFISRNQCGVGGFRLVLKDEPAGKACTPHMDSTGMALQALIAAGVDREGVSRGLGWLQGKQERDGSFKDLTLQEDDKSGNANSTALAVQALIAGDRMAQAGKGIRWLADAVQVGCDKNNGGAVGWNEPVADGKALRATAQAIPALAGKPFEYIDGRNSPGDVATIRCVADDTDGTPSRTPSTSATTSGESTKPGTASPSPGTTTPAPTDTATATATPTATATSTSDTTTGGGSGGTGGSSSDTGTSSGTSTGATTGSGTDNASGSLARTGANTAYPVAIGAGALLLAGSAAVVVSRRRRRDDAG